jgi:hypothetical protein
MFQRIRRSFRKKKASYCINCGHTTRDCYHKEYENINDLSVNSSEAEQATKSDHLKWLDLDLMNQNQSSAVTRAPNNLVLSRQRNLQVQRPHSAVYNEYTNLPIRYPLPGASFRTVR